MGYLNGPVNTLADFQLEFNGLLMGAGTPYDMPPTWHLMDMAPIKTMDASRVWADGSWSGPDYADVLLIDLPVTVAASDAETFTAAVNALAMVCVPQTSTAALWFKLPNQVARGISAKTNKRVLPIDLGWPRISDGAIQFRCPDPAWQSIPSTVTLSPSGQAVSGLSFPLFAPASGTYTSPGALDFGFTASGSSSPSLATLTNTGNSPAWPVVVLGASSAPVSVVIDGNYVTYGAAIPSGSSVTIDYKAGTATISGGVDRTYALTARNFTPVTSSSSAIFVAAPSSAACTITTANVWR